MKIGIKWYQGGYVREVALSIMGAHEDAKKLINNPWLFYWSRNIYVITARCADVILGPESFWQPEGND